MIITKKQFYNKAIWKKKRKEIMLKQPFCNMCGGFKQLECHHVVPVQWRDDDTIEVNDLNELIDVPLVMLCHACHMSEDKGKGKAVDNVSLLMGW